MSSSNLRIRRATTDDFPGLRALWASLRLPADELEKRLTEFQVIETAGGQIAGAIGFQIIRQHARLHSEAYTDFGIADEARQLFWERIRLIASNQGVFRLWIQENSPFWNRLGFRIVITESLRHLPEEWKRFEGKWYSLQLKNEEALVTLEKELAASRELEKERTAQTLGHARTLKTVVIVICFGIFAICVVILIYLVTHRRQ